MDRVARSLSLTPLVCVFCVCCFSGQTHVAPLIVAIAAAAAVAVAIIVFVTAAAATVVVVVAATAAVVVVVAAAAGATVIIVIVAEWGASCHWVFRVGIVLSLRVVFAA